MLATQAIKKNISLTTQNKYQTWNEEIETENSLVFFFVEILLIQCLVYLVLDIGTMDFHVEIFSIFPNMFRKVEIYVYVVAHINYDVVEGPGYLVWNVRFREILFLSWSWYW